MGASLKIPSSLDRRAAILGMGLVAALLLAGAAAISYFFYLHPLLQSRAAQGWTEVPCRIHQCSLTSHVSHGRHGTSTTYNLAVDYSYEVGGVAYRSNNYDFTLGATDDYGWWEAGASRFRPGKPAVCYVNPQNSAMAVLVRDFDRNPGLWIFSGGMAAIGLLVAASTIYHAWRRVKFGQSVLELADAPAALGNPLAGNIALSRIVQPAEGFALRLACIHRVVTGVGKSRHVQEDVLWHDEKQIGADALGNAIPLTFALPADGLATDNVDPSNCIFWQLTAKAKMPGVDYASQFAVPVVAGSRQARRAVAPVVPDPASADVRELTGDEETPSAAFVEESDNDAHFQQPVRSRIRVQDTPTGKEFYFSAFRNPGAFVFLTIFTLLWTTAVWAMIHSQAPLPFILVFGVLDGLMILWTLHEGLATTRVVAERGGITVKNWFGLTRTWTMAAADIREIKIVHGATFNNTVLYNVQIVHQDGSRVTAGDEISDVHEAHWLALEMARCVGLRS